MSLDSKIAKTPISIGGDMYTFGELVGINPDAINDEYVSQPGRLAYLNMLMANAEAAHQEEKAKTERVYAQIELDYREELKSQRTTEAQIKSMVLDDKDYILQVANEHKQLKEYKQLRGLVEALKERGSMLVSLGANLRQEYDVTDMSLRQTKDRIRELARD